MFGQEYPMIYTVLLQRCMRGYAVRKKIRRVRYSIPIQNLVSCSFKKTVINYDNELVAKIEEQLGDFEPKLLNDGEPVILKPRMIVEADGVYTGEWSTKSNLRHGTGTLI
jgi:hypothetical protein